jgi:hypothetical protein
MARNVLLDFATVQQVAPTPKLVRANRPARGPIPENSFD